MSTVGGRLARDAATHCATHRRNRPGWSGDTANTGQRYAKTCPTDARRTEAGQSGPLGRTLPNRTRGRIGRLHGASAQLSKLRRQLRSWWLRHRGDVQGASRKPRPAFPQRPQVSAFPARSYREPSAMRMWLSEAGGRLPNAGSKYILPKRRCPPRTATAPTDYDKATGELPAVCFHYFKNKETTWLREGAAARGSPSLPSGGCTAQAAFENPSSSVSLT